MGQDDRRAVRKAATFSSCRRYRYALARTWDVDLPVVHFVGLNPSTADEYEDDNTVRRCIGYARLWGYGGLLLTNLFAYRSTDPSALQRVRDPVGPGNDHSIARCCASAGLTVVAWGTRGSLHGRGKQVLAAVKHAHCLGLTKYGAPRHPLYLPAGLYPELYPGS